MFIALKPDKTPLGLYPDMAAAQGAIAADEPDIVKQGAYQIHPTCLDTLVADANRLKLNMIWKIERVAFDGDDLSKPVEILVREGVN